MTYETTTAIKVAPLLKRNDSNIIIDTFGDVSKPHQCVTIALAAHKVDSEGFTDEEVAHVTIPLLGDANVILKAWLSVALPGYTLQDNWAVYAPCPCDAVECPF